MKADFASFLDALAKMDAESRLPSGGDQYMMEVALGPSASAKNQARMRVQKKEPIKPQPLASLIRQYK